jgi:N-acyl homoserine lactone hydrolase
VGCDHAKIHEPALRQRFNDLVVSGLGAPEMSEEQRIPHHLARLGLTPADVDVIFIGHLHFDHAGGLKELRRCGCGAEIHVQQDEMEVARSGADSAVFADDLIDDGGTLLQVRPCAGEYTLVPGVQAIDSIRKLKTISAKTGAWIWPNHDMAFYRTLQSFPQAYE